MPRKGSTKITEQKFNDIARRLAAGSKDKDIALATGYAISTIAEIRNVKTWAVFQERRQRYAQRKSADRAMHPAPLPQPKNAEDRRLEQAAKPGFSPEVRKQVAETMTQARDRAAAKNGVARPQAVTTKRPIAPSVQDELAATNRRIDGLTKGSEKAFHTLEDDQHSHDKRLTRVEHAVAAIQQDLAKKVVAKPLTLRQRILRRFQS